MKRITLLLLFALTAVLGTTAQSLSYLTFRTADGTEQSLTAVGLKLTFSDGQLVATGNDGTTTFSLTDLSSMFFSETVTGISNVSGASATKVRIVNGALKVTAPAGSTISVRTTDGRQVNKDQYLPKGMYIVRVNNQSFKVLSE
ncbi:MAG: hypothetical protein Q4E59_02380 [Bacteroidales bacterium]|nr:hypothetical protein [Bacteroidales bacterium]